MQAPSGSVWFPAVAPLPVSLGRTVPAVAAASRGPAEGYGSGPVTVAAVISGCGRRDFQPSRATCKVRPVRGAGPGVLSPRLPGRSPMSVTPGRTSLRLCVWLPWALGPPANRRDEAPAPVEPTSPWPQGMWRGSDCGCHSRGLSARWPHLQVLTPSLMY